MDYTIIKLSFHFQALSLEFLCIYWLFIMQCYFLWLVYGMNWVINIILYLQNSHNTMLKRALWLEPSQHNVKTNDVMWHRNKWHDMTYKQTMWHNTKTNDVMWNLMI
jgi:hypothetical protein